MLDTLARVIYLLGKGPIGIGLAILLLIGLGPIGWAILFIGSILFILSKK